MYKITTLDDKYYKKYTSLFNYSLNKFNLINYYLLFNYTIQDDNKICNYLFDINYIYYKSIFLKDMYGAIYKNKLNLNFDNYIISNIKKNKTTLYIQNYGTIIKYDYLLKNKNMGDLLYYDKYNDMNFYHNYVKKEITKIVNENVYNNLYLLDTYEIYKQFLKNLKNNKEDNNISIPKKKYEVITCNFGNILGLGLTASYKMNFNLTYVISNISIVFKTIIKGGTLLLFWSIVNVNIPIIKKILALLSYTFNNIEIIDNDINQNFLIGVPQFYIKCSGYKDNISNDIVNNLLDISCDALEYIYDICDVLNYYEDYTTKNPNNAMFYKIEGKTTYKNTTKKSSSIRKSSTNKSTNSQKPIIPIYYIEDINIPELDEIMKDKKLMFKVDSLSNKLETIFVGYFEMVNNLIVNAIAKDKHGKMYVKSSYILQKDITNLTGLINIFEYYKLPYNKHALKILLGKQNELIKNFYSLDNPVNLKLIQYGDRISKILNKNALISYRLSKTSSTKSSITSSTLSPSTKKDKTLENSDIINNYYSKIKLSQQVKFKLLEEIDFINYSKHVPKYVEYAAYDFPTGLGEYLNSQLSTTININIDINIDIAFIKLWEILSTFNLIPNTVKSFRTLHLCESSGQSIMCMKYWAKNKCINMNMNNYEWLANGISPYTNGNANTKSNPSLNIVYESLIKYNYDKWLWGSDNTGDLTNINNIKSIMNTIKLKWGGSNKMYTNMDTNMDTKIDLIICDDNIEFNQNTYSLTNNIIELTHVLSVIACSSIGGSCCVKHFIPYKNLDEIQSSNNLLETSYFFINYLYLYYILFDSVSLYKPISSKPNNGEFYVIGKNFKGITEDQLDNLFTIISNFTLEDTIIDNDKIPLTFIYQLSNFLDEMSNINIQAIEKQNLLLTCYKNLYENKKTSDSDSGDSKSDKIKYNKTNKILKCNNFFNSKVSEHMLIPKYKEWVKIFNFS